MQKKFPGRQRRERDLVIPAVNLLIQTLIKQFPVVLLRVLQKNRYICIYLGSSHPPQLRERIPHNKSWDKKTQDIQSAN